jgi:spore coat protein U-like protein
MKRLIITSIATAMLGLAAPSFAATATGSFDVNVQVLATCSISASNLSFSDITTGTTTNNDASSTLTVNCSSGTPYTVALDNGTNYSVGRRMASGASYINYVLYSDSTRSTQWNSTNTKTGTGSGSDQNLTVYGRIPSSQSVTNTGSYGDTVIATVSY